MIYICVPSRDEDRTVGVLLWKIRQVMQDLRRDFHVLVLDDGSRDETRALLEKYRTVLPLTVLTEKTPVGYGRAVEKLLRAANGMSRYPKRDAIVIMQGDFTEPPDHLRSLTKSIESGADIVFAEAVRETPRLPLPVRLARRVSRAILRAMRPEPLPGDPLQGFRAYRLMVVRKALRARKNRRLLNTDGWAANAELAEITAPYARQVAAVPLEKRYDLRRRPTRVRPFGAVRAMLSLRAATRPLCAAALFTVLASTSPQAAETQQSLLVLDSLTAESHKVANIPFAPGETLQYALRASIFGGGEAHMTVGQVDTVNGFPVFPVEWRIEGSVLGVGVNEKFQSWLDLETLVSRRFVKEQDTAGRQRYREFNFYPEERLVRRIDHDTTWALPTALPLDDISFVYFTRTLPLEVGETYTYNRFYKDEGNPVVLRVLRKDRIEVPAGTFDTIVVQPIIQTDGLFADGGQAEIHFSDDEQRLVVYLRADMGLLLPTLEMSLATVEPERADSDGSR